MSEGPLKKRKSDVGRTTPSASTTQATERKTAESPADSEDEDGMIMMALQVETKEVQTQQAIASKSDMFERLSTEVLALAEHVFNNGSRKAAIRYLDTLCRMTVRDPILKSKSSQTNPREAREDYSASCTYHFSNLQYSHVPYGRKAGASMDWAFTSSWVWRSEQMHDAHLSETMTGTLTVKNKKLLEFFSYNKPYHETYGGGLVDQRWLVVHKANLEQLKKVIAPDDNMYFFLLFLGCGAQHMSESKGLRYSLYNLIAQAGAQNVEVPYRQITIILSDERGDPAVTRTLGCDPATGATITQWSSFKGWSGCSPPPPSIR